MTVTLTDIEYALERLSGVAIRPLDEALTFLETEADLLLPPGYSVDYTGESRQLRKEGNKFLPAFALAVVLIFLVLAAQFNSFRDPFVVLLSVPLSIFGAVVPIALGFATLNIYTQIGLLTLIGLISKHGILIVEFANQQVLQGLDRREAVLIAASQRLRPILMTTFATVLGVWPLVIASGAGANSRFSIGLMISAGFVYLSAPDLALTQISVETVTIMLLLLALHFLPKHTPAESSRALIARDAAIAVAAGGSVAAMAFTPDHMMLATAETRGQVSIWDLSTANTRYRWEYFRENPRNLALSPDGEFLALGCLDGTLILLDLNSGQEAFRATAPEGLITALDFDASGKRIATASVDMNAVLWDLSEWM